MAVAGDRRGEMALTGQRSAMFAHVEPLWSSLRRHPANVVLYGGWPGGCRLGVQRSQFFPCVEATSERVVRVVPENVQAGEAAADVIVVPAA